MLWRRDLSVHVCDFSFDGSLILCGNSDSITILSAVNGKEIWSKKVEYQVLSCKFDDDNKKYITFGGCNDMITRMELDFNEDDLMRTVNNSGDNIIFTFSRFNHIRFLW
mgnify:CR=1 FL=1